MNGIKNYLKKVFAVSDKGATDLVKAITCETFVSFSLMIVSALIFRFLKDGFMLSLENKNPTFQIGIYFLYAVILFVLIFVCYYFAYNSNYIAAYKESANKRISLAETMRKLPLSFFGKKDLSDVTTTIMGDATILEQAYSHFIPQFFGSLIATIIICIGLVTFNVKMGLATIWVIPTALILCFTTKKFQDNYSIKSKNIQLSYNDKIVECIENIKDIKTNNRKEAHKRIVDEKLVAYEKAAIMGELGSAIPVVIAQMILKVGIATSMLQGINMLTTGELEIFDFILFMAVVTRVLEPVTGSLINMAAMFASLISINRMKELENTPIQTGKDNCELTRYDISFDNVSFSYNDDEPVIDGLSFVAKQGEITALVGSSGGGKSTALKLAARFWDINDGTIKIGDENISEVDPETLLENISIIFQDVTLFNNTVLENIRIGKKDATDAEIMKVAKEAHCDEFVNKLPDGYNSYIGENGFSLSGGERQRISIARALLKDAPIILLDEATSSLDIESETAVQNAISKLVKDKTVMIIAHRMRTIAGADKIVLIKNGKVSEEGTHNELVEIKGDYSNMIDLQTKSLNWSLE